MKTSRGSASGGSAPARLVLRAPAKVNLTLAVGERRADGFHSIDSLCLALTLADRLTIEAGSAGAGLELTVCGPAAEGVPEGEANLAWRAARSVQEWAVREGRPLRNLSLRLEKQVPGQAGLGGGSADAAASAFGCARLLGLDPDHRTLAAILAELGSDCSFFLRARHTGLARCTGRGEVVEPLSAVFPWWVVVATPDFGCATGAVYDAHRAPTNPVLAAAPDATVFGATLAGARAHIRNDLERAAEHIEPRLARFRGLLQEIASGLFRLSGSGSSCFALLADEASARALVLCVRQASEARRFALRGLWTTRAAGLGLGPENSILQFEQSNPA